MDEYTSLPEDSPIKIVSELPSKNNKNDEYPTGALRDSQENKGRPSLIPPDALRRIALRYEAGASKYGENNWQKGMPLSRFYDAIFRHLLAWGEGKTDEDHLGAIGWNMASAAWTEKQINEGKLPKELNDLAYREKMSFAFFKDPIDEWLKNSKSI